MTDRFFLLGLFPVSLFWVRNAAWFLATFLLIFILLKAGFFLLSGRDNSGWTRRRGLFAGFLIGLSLIPLSRIPGAVFRLLPFYAAYGLGVGWFVFSQLDPLRSARKRGFLERLGIGSVVAVLLLLLGWDLILLRQGIPSQRLPIAVYDPHQILVDEGGFWFSDTVGTTAGLWRYDAQTGKARPFLRAQGVTSFCFYGGFFYLHDAFGSELIKVDAKTGQLLFRHRMPAERGPFSVKEIQGRIFCIGQGGYFALYDTDGLKKVERLFPFEVRYPQPLPDGRLLLVAADHPPHLRIVGADPSQDEEIPLPSASGRSVMAMEVVARTGQLVVACRGGEILRYDLRARRWLSSYKASPGIRAIAADAQNGFLFVYNDIRGTVEVMELASGRRKAMAIASGFGNRLTVIPEVGAAILSTHGPFSLSVPKPGGLYRFDYSSL